MNDSTSKYPHLHLVRHLVESQQQPIRMILHEYPSFLISPCPMHYLMNSIGENSLQNDFRILASDDKSTHALIPSASQIDKFLCMGNSFPINASAYASTGQSPTRSLIRIRLIPLKEASYSSKSLFKFDDTDLFIFPTTFSNSGGCSDIFENLSSMELK